MLTCVLWSWNRCRPFWIAKEPAGGEPTGVHISGREGQGLLLFLVVLSPLSTASV